jgi:hypothetical protein
MEVVGRRARIEEWQTRFVATRVPVVSAAAETNIIVCLGRSREFQFSPTSEIFIFTLERESTLESRGSVRTILSYYPGKSSSLIRRNAVWLTPRTI